MTSRRLLRVAGLVFAACTCISVAACSNDPEVASDTFYGPSADIGNGTVRTFTTVDDDGNPTVVGIRLSEGTMDGLPTVDEVPPKMLMLDFPDQASGTVFDHVMMNWNSQGHVPPPLFGKPHFDVHFFMTDMSSVMSIDPADPDFATKASRLPDAKYIPSDFGLLPGPPVAEQAVPGMGVHLVDSTENFVPGVYDFQQTFINGVWDGRYTFIEPMMTREYLLTHPTLSQDVKQPSAYQKSGYFPTRYTIRYDDVADEYVIALEGLTMREAS